MNRAAPAILAGALLVAADVRAQQTQIDPDSAETHARAVEALSRMERLAVSGETRQIVGVNLAVSGKTEDISGLLRDLKAETRGSEVRIELSADVLFDFDKADLRPEAAQSLDKVAAVLRANPKARARVEGHTDSRGTDAYNRRLSDARADSVRKALAAKGVSNAIEARGHGSAKPVVPNTTKDGKDNPDGRRRNRRVDIVVQGVEQASAAQAARR